ncbi:MAG: cation:proton antiporter [Candidatus Kerfeldbacteria bacterium]|nr:cation:proton antiporter [Candidatus Kerfeldbacteria bacterium]
MASSRLGSLFSRSRRLARHRVLLFAVVAFIAFSPLVTPAIARTEPSTTVGETAAGTDVVGTESSGSTAEEGGHSGFAKTFLWIAVILVAAKLSSLVERFGQPSVLGELVIGVILGNLTLVGIHVFQPIMSDGIIAFLAELGVVLLLFQIGLESNIAKMRRVGVRALLVAVVGVVLPFVLGTYVVGPWLLPGLTSHAYLFIGATLTATSVGITARVFRDLGKLQTSESQIVLGAAVIDDVLGLIILAVVSAIVTVGSVSIGAISWIVAKAVLFLIGAIVVGTIAAPRLGRAFSKIHTGVGMKFTLALVFGLVFAYLASVIGLAPIVGAFAAGLVLDAVHFRFFREPGVVADVRAAVQHADPQVRERVSTTLEHHAQHHIEDLIEPLSYLFVPIFFVVTGMNVRLDTLFDGPVLLVALGLTVAAFVGKILAGFVAGRGQHKWLVGWGMVPRGEVGLIFATIGRSLGVVTDDVFSVIVIMIILSTLIPPPILAVLLKRRDARETTASGKASASLPTA